ncbi:MAG: toxin co-regulated pilus biosynthesis Q family protein [Alphaproteobacteria bacterium]|nr:toxin co-regulated pilus biosynthesis Q family protein [Alphaproteobacteria bacterium]
MFRKILIAGMFATAAGYCFAATEIPQVVTSEVYYVEDKTVKENTVENTVAEQQVSDNVVAYDDGAYAPVPAWPLAGSDADVVVSCNSGACVKKSDAGDQGNIKIVSKIGADMYVENNFNFNGRAGTGWSGGADLLHGDQIPVGFDDECARGSEMPWLRREVLEDDGGNVLSVSRSARRNCDKKYADRYDSYLAKNGLIEKTPEGAIVTGGGVVDTDGNVCPEGTEWVENSFVTNKFEVNGFDNEPQDSNLMERTSFSDIVVDSTADAEPAVQAKDGVRSWVVANGQTLREVLQSWCDKEGWDLVWATSREYPIQASAVFKGRFLDVASAVVRNFGRAVPAPYAKFYKGNRVLVVSASEE